MIKIINIIVPTYKARDTLPDLLDSLVAQTKKRFFVTIVNDADGLDYSDIIEKYESRGLNIQYIYAQTNTGPGGARNIGMDNSGMCDYIAFCDADDMVSPVYVEMLYDYTKANNADVGVSPIFHERKHGVSNIIENGSNTTWTHGKIYRLQYLKDNGIKFNNMRVNEDCAFNLLALNLTKKIVTIKQYVYLWRDYENSITRSNSLEFTKIGNRCYIEGTIDSILYIYEKTRNIKRFQEFVISYIPNWYNFFQQIKLIDGELGASREKISNILNMEEIKPILHSKKLQSSIIEEAKVGRRIKENFYYFTQNPIDWLEEMKNFNSN